MVSDPPVMGSSSRRHVVSTKGSVEGPSRPFGPRVPSGPAITLHGSVKRMTPGGQALPLADGAVDAGGMSANATHTSNVMAAESSDPAPSEEVPVGTESLGTEAPGVD